MLKNYKNSWIFHQVLQLACPPKIVKPPANEPTPTQVEACTTNKSEFLLGRREASTRSPTLQRMLPANAGAQRVTSRAQERTSSGVTSRSILPARRGAVKFFGTSFTAPGGCAICGGSRTTRSRQLITLRGWRSSWRLHHATRPRRLSSRKHLPRCAWLHLLMVEADRVICFPLGANAYLPTWYVLSSLWVLNQNTQHGPTRSI